MVYTAETPSLAALEMLVHLDADQLLRQFYVLIPVEFDESLVEAIGPADLPDNWNDSSSPPELRAIGDDWIRSRRSLVLKVPSAVVPQERLFLLNPEHRNADKLQVGEPQSFQYDPRLLK